MELSEVKYNLGKPVRLSLPMHSIDNKKYLLTGCILRMRSTGEFFYQAELTDLKSDSVIIASLGDVSAIELD
ncbi:MAG: hypothetical protein ACI4K7_11265 [Oscillospiraceae bacterium]